METLCMFVEHNKLILNSLRFAGGSTILTMYLDLYNT